MFRSFQPDRRPARRFTPRADGLEERISPGSISGVGVCSGSFNSGSFNGSFNNSSNGNNNGYVGVCSGSNGNSNGHIGVYNGIGNVYSNGHIGVCNGIGNVYSNNNGNNNGGR